MIPEELQRLPQWTYSFSTDEPKRPTHYNYPPYQGLSYEEAKAHEGNGISIGLYVTKQDPYILGDIDHIEDVHNPFNELPIELVDLLTSHPTYMEISPSGKGIRFIYKFHSKDEKKVTNNKYFVGLTTGKETQVNIGPPWMRMTGKVLNGSPGYISTVDWSDLEQAYAVHYVRGSNVTTPVPTTQAPLVEVQEHLMRIPLDQNLRVQRAFQTVFEGSYHHYTFWMKVMMALHCYAEATNQMIECLSLAIQWSATDPSAFTGEEDVANHWRSLSNGKCEVISHKTLFKLANLCTLQWPVPRPVKNKKVTRRLPLNTELANMQYMMNYYNIRLCADVGNPMIYYITGDEDIMRRYMGVRDVTDLFGKYYGPFDIQRLVSAFQPFCQEIGFSGLSRGMLKDHLLTIIHLNNETFDPIEYYFSTPLEEMPPSYRDNIDHIDRSTFDDLFDCIKIDHMTNNKEREEGLYRDYYKKWLCGLIRSMYYRDTPSTNNCVLLLTGAEQIRKTSHFRYMLPKWMRDRYVVFTTHGFNTAESIRDITKIAASTRLIVWDEFDQFLNQTTESNLKKVIDNTPQTVIDKYEVIPKTIYPVAMYGATSNLREFKLGGDTNRRIFHIPVRWVDTDSMANICWHKLINDLYAEVQRELEKGVTPWLLSDDQLQYQATLHGLLRSKNNIDIMLEETFDFDGNAGVQTGVLMGVSSVQTDPTKRLMSTKEVNDTLSKYHSQAYGISKPALIHALHRLCGNYTRTTKVIQHMVHPSGYIEKGMFIQGPHRRWVMPPLREDITKGTFGSVF